MDEPPSTGQQTQPTTRRPIIILFYVFLQALAASFSTVFTTILFRDIVYRQCQRSGPPASIPEVDPCHLESSVALPLFFGLTIMLSFVVAGPFGRIMDMRGRKGVMAASGLLNVAGDLWLYVCASVPALHSSIYPAMLSAILKGIGGASLVMQVAHWSLIAVTTRPARRSVWFSLALFTSWIGYWLARMIAFVTGMVAKCDMGFMVTAGCWTAYALAAAGPLRDEPVAHDGDSDIAPWTITIVLRSVIEPIRLLLRPSSLTVLAISYAAAHLVVGALDSFFFLAVSRFRGGSQSISFFFVFTQYFPVAVALCALPLFVAIYRWVYKDKLHQTRTEASKTRTKASQTSPLLASRSVVNEADGTASTEDVGASSEMTFLWEEEATISRISFIAAAVGVLVALLGRSVVVYIIGISMAMFIIPALPFILAMVTYKAETPKMASTLTGVAILESIVASLRAAPTIMVLAGLSRLSISLNTAILSSGMILSICGVVVISKSLWPAKGKELSAASSETTIA